MVDVSVSFDSVIKHFESLPDPRHTRNRRHELGDAMGCQKEIAKKIVTEQGD